MSGVQEIVAALAAWRAVEPMNDAAIAAWVDREKQLVAALVRSPALTLEEAEAKARELAHLLGVADFDELWTGLAGSLACDVGRLSRCG